MRIVQGGSAWRNPPYGVRWRHRTLPQTVPPPAYNHGMSPELAVLTAMITPAVLISACGALILSTSVRLGRVVDRVRSLSDRFEELAHREPGDTVLYEERLELTFTQLDWLTSRARHLQRAMTTFYLALGLFVATTVTIGFLGISSPIERELNWVPVILGMVGAGLLFIGTILLGFEATLALRSIHAEMDFVWKLGRHHAPAPLLSRLASRSLWPPFRPPRG
jgi:hypothetical protein